jgi:hypothetical protein
MLLLLAGGCGYDVTESTTYRAANWTSDGKIIARRLTLKHGKNLISNSIPMGSSEEIVLMNEDGSGEHKLFDVNENMIMLIEMSPRGSYVGYINGDGELKVYTRGGALVGRVKPDPPVTYFKFSPDETKIYGTQDFHNMVFYSVPDLIELDRNDFGGGGIFVGNDIVLYDDRIAKEMASYRINEGKTLLGNTFPYTPQVYDSQSNTVYSLGADKVYRYVLGAAGYETRPLSWSPYAANDFTGEHLRGDGGRVVMSWRGAEASGVGVYTLDITTSEIRQIR